jgi:serine/threonine protein kinase
MAPELWTGDRNFTPALDLWSLGLILWEMCTLKRFFGKSAVGKIFDLMRLRSPEEEAAGVRGHFPELEPVLTRLLQRDPSLRPSDPLQMAETFRGLRQRLPPSGDLVQFVRLIRAGRLEPEARAGSLIALPALPPESGDWAPLIDVATAANMAVSSDSIPLIPTTARQIGPVAPSESDDLLFVLEEGSPTGVPFDDADLTGPTDIMPPGKNRRVDATVSRDRHEIPNGSRGLSPRWKLAFGGLLSLVLLLLVLRRLGLL